MDLPSQNKMDQTRSINNPLADWEYISYDIHVQLKLIWVIYVPNENTSFSSNQWRRQWARFVWYRKENRKYQMYAIGNQLQT